MQNLNNSLSQSLSQSKVNTSYLTDSYIGFTLQLGSGQDFALTSELGQLYMAKENISNFPPCRKMVVLNL